MTLQNGGRFVAMPSSAQPTHADASERPIIEVERIAKSFGSVQALAGVSLVVQPKEIRCLLGENGAGKSTLCNLLFGVYRADEGNMIFRGREFVPSDPAEALRAGIAMVHQHFSLIPTLSVLDNLMLGRSRGWLRRSVAREEIDALTARLDVALELDSKVENLPVGVRQLVEIVKCLLADPKLLLLDEPTAVLPVTEIESFLGTVRRIADGGCAVVLVTHKLAEVASAADSATVLRHGRVVAQSRHPAAEIDALAAAMIGRDAPRALRSRRDVQSAAPQTVDIEARAATARDALRVEQLGLRDVDGAAKLEEVTLAVRTGEIVGIAGVEGNGQSELCSILAGVIRPTAGRIRLANDDITRAKPSEIAAAGVGIIPEDRHAVGCILDMTVAENLLIGQLDGYRGSLGMLDRKRMNVEAARLIERYDIRCDGPTAFMHELSGGNQQKVVLARELSRENLRLVVAAHPTRGLDVGAVESVYLHLQRAAERAAGVLLLTSELDELFAMSDRIVVMYRGRIAGELHPHEYRSARLGALMSGQKVH